MIGSSEISKLSLKFDRVDIGTESKVISSGDKTNKNVETVIKKLMIINSCTEILIFLWKIG